MHGDRYRRRSRDNVLQTFQPNGQRDGGRQTSNIDLLRLDWTRDSARGQNLDYFGIPVDATDGIAGRRLALQIRNNGYRLDRDRGRDRHLYGDAIWDQADTFDDCAGTVDRL